MYQFGAFAISQTKFENTEGWEAHILENIEDENEFDWRRLNRSIVNTSLPCMFECSRELEIEFAQNEMASIHRSKNTITHSVTATHSIRTKVFRPMMMKKKKWEKKLGKNYLRSTNQKVDLFSPKLVYINRLMDSNAIKSIDPTEWNKREVSNRFSVISSHVPKFIWSIHFLRCAARRLCIDPMVNVCSNCAAVTAAATAHLGILN